MAARSIDRRRRRRRRKRRRTDEFAGINTGVVGCDQKGAVTLRVKTKAVNRDQGVRDKLMT